MDINAAFPSKYIRACDLEGKDRVVTIVAVDVDDVSGDGDIKPIMHMEDHKPLVLNKTNSNKISGFYGSETDNWIGKQVVLHPTVTDFAGKEVACIRIKPVNPISPNAETVYQAALKHVTALSADPTGVEPEQITKIVERLEQQHAARSLSDGERDELVKLARSLKVMPARDVNDDVPF